MRLFIPDIGTKLVLLSSWTAGIQHEARNLKLLLTMKENGGDDIELKFWGSSQTYLTTTKTKFPMTFPAGTELTVDRVYIRKGSSEFSSVSFYVEDCPIRAFTSKKKGGTYTGKPRFFASLADVNSMDIDETALEISTE
jgi:hypothetical protein